MSISVHKVIKAMQFDGNNGATIAAELRKSYDIDAEGRLEIEGLAARPTEWFVWSVNQAREGGGLVTVFEESPVPDNVFWVKYAAAAATPVEAAEELP